MEDQMGKKTGYSDHTAYGQSIKSGGIVTGMDKLHAPQPSEEGVHEVFKSSPSRDINVGSRTSANGIDYKALKK